MPVNPKDLKRLEAMIRRLPKEAQARIIAELVPVYRLKATKNAKKYRDTGATIASQQVEESATGAVLSYGTRAAVYLVGGKGKASAFGSGKSRVFRPKGLRAMARKVVKNALAKLEAAT